MDINNLVSREQIKKDQERGDQADSRFWRIPDGKSVIRLLPRLENQVPYKTVLSHRYNANGEKVFGTCTKTFGKKDCPVCKQSWWIHEKVEDKELRDMGYHSRATARFLYNCYIVNDPEKPENNGTIKIISVGKKLQDLILESFNSEDLGNTIFDAINGVNFEINRKKSGDNPAFPDYSSSRFIFKKEPIVSNWDAIKDKLINIDELIKEETAEELKEKFKFLGFTTTPTTSAPKAKTPAAAPAVKKEPETNEEEDINIDELEADNGNEEEVVSDSGIDDIDIDDELEQLEKL